MSAASTTYLKDGIKSNGDTIYKVDYSILEFSDDWTFEKRSDIDRALATDNSNVIVMDSEVITDIVLKIPSKDNPNSYDIDASGGTFKIINVETLGDQLNKYNLKFPIEGGTFTHTLLLQRLLLLLQNLKWLQVMNKLLSNIHIVFLQSYNRSLNISFALLAISKLR